MSSNTPIFQKRRTFENATRARMVVTDGVLSMKGYIAGLPEIKALPDQYNSGLYLDEAGALRRHRCLRTALSSAQAAWRFVNVAEMDIFLMAPLWSYHASEPVSPPGPWASRT